MPRIGSKPDAVERRAQPAGTIRITTSEHAATTVLWPALRGLLKQCPDINVEIRIDSGLTDNVADRFDAGVRLGEALALDMIAVRMAIVGSPDDLAAYPPPETLQHLAGGRGPRYARTHVPWPTIPSTSP